MVNITSCHISFNVICPICYASILRASIALYTVLTGVAYISYEAKYVRIPYGYAHWT